MCIRDRTYTVREREIALELKQKIQTLITQYKSKADYLMTGQSRNLPPKRNSYIEDDDNIFADHSTPRLREPEDFIMNGGGKFEDGKNSDHETPEKQTKHKKEAAEALYVDIYFSFDHDMTDPSLKTINGHITNRKLQVSKGFNMVQYNENIDEMLEKVKKRGERMVFERIPIAQPEKQIPEKTNFDEYFAKASSEKAVERLEHSSLNDQSTVDTNKDISGINSHRHEDLLSQDYKEVHSAPIRKPLDDLLDLQADFTSSAPANVNCDGKSTDLI
eukprot:TRINITY_DN3042_c0_g1_i2.p1 TRINITY_DN3042_c0_g1~~TRINITY_DN3042_c0_g1_i2.p1  ORF type:complete len:304 (-),score=42.85 TRINITY_DN3042_c0_g1_i2:390-1214(-)